jgi:hypothetical protein
MIEIFKCEVWRPYNPIHIVCINYVCKCVEEMMYVSIGSLFVENKLCI